ncbi:MAG TPA: S41 family peptidase [Parapedobacter sp.]|nr:S41 family peptidase [Parapedobacter sp.]
MSIVLFTALLIVSSCEKKDPTPEPQGDVTNAEINRWILDTMDYYYYWNDKIPNEGSLNLNSNPEDFFESLLNLPTDRFSWIQNATELKEQSSGIIKTTGLGISFISNEQGQVVLGVRYVHKGSPADLQGVKRGDMFIGINGEDWKVSGSSITNAAPLFGNDTFTLQECVFENDALTRGKTISLTPVEAFQENAILLDSIITTSSGTKVAYLFYNRFLGNQLQELVDAFVKFKEANVTELIVDERYNGGGHVVAASLLSALIHKNFNIASPFIHYDMNNHFKDVTETYGEQFGYDNEELVTQVNLGLSRVFVLATENSASASELLINNLKPFLGGSNVIHIGSITVGKDEFSSAFESSSPRLKANDDTDWGIQPIIGKYKNADLEGDFEAGLRPQYAVRESNYPYAPMGSSEDRLIARALSIIDPSMTAQLSKQMSLQPRHTGARELKEVNDKLLKPYRPLEVTPLPKRKPIKLH